jgi:hypothetical protein
MSSGSLLLPRVVGTVLLDRHQVVAKDDQQHRHAVRGANVMHGHERAGGNHSQRTGPAQSRQAEPPVRTQAGSSSLLLCRQGSREVETAPSRR